MRSQIVALVLYTASIFLGGAAFSWWAVGYTPEDVPAVFWEILDGAKTPPSYWLELLDA